MGAKSMIQYTKQLKNIQCEISPEDDNYTEKLISVVKSFRDFDEALDVLLFVKDLKEMWKM